MAVQKRSYRDYVQVIVPTKDKIGYPLPTALVDRWKELIRATFKRYAEGLYVSPCYVMEGEYFSSQKEWIKEHNFVVETFAPPTVCRNLIEVLETEIVERVITELRQESIAIESSLDGLVIYEIQA
jgi:hypothetical protein